MSDSPQRGIKSRNYSAVCDIPSERKFHEFVSLYTNSVSLFPTNLLRDSKERFHKQPHTYTSYASRKPTKTNEMPYRSVHTEKQICGCSESQRARSMREKELWIRARESTPLSDDLTIPPSTPLLIPLPLTHTCTRTLHQYSLLLSAFVSLLSIPDTDEITPLISFQMLWFGGIWETFQCRATDHKPIRSPLPSRVILNSCRTLSYDTRIGTADILN